MKTDDFEVTVTESLDESLSVASSKPRTVSNVNRIRVDVTLAVQAQTTPTEEKNSVEEKRAT